MNCVVFRWVEFGHPCHTLFTYTRILVTTQSFHPGDIYALHISVTHSSLWYTPCEIKLVLVWMTLPCACHEILPSSARSFQLYDTQHFPFDTVPSPSYRIPHNKNTAVPRISCYPQQHCRAYPKLLVLLWNVYLSYNNRGICLLSHRNLQIQTFQEGLGCI
jgi:hypothetical protein